jgi:hypothetical protein
MVPNTTIAYYFWLNVQDMIYDKKISQKEFQIKINKLKNDMLHSNKYGRFTVEYRNLIEKYK